MAVDGCGEVVEGLRRGRLEIVDKRLSGRKGRAFGCGLFRGRSGGAATFRRGRGGIITVVVCTIERLGVVELLGGVAETSMQGLVQVIELVRYIGGRGGVAAR